MHVRLWKYLWRKLSYKLLCNRVAKHWQKTWIESIFLKPQTFGGKSKLLQLLPPEEKVNRGSTASALETSVRQSPWMLSTTSLIRARRPKLGMREWFPALPRKAQNMAKGAGASRAVHSISDPPALPQREPEKRRTASQHWISLYSKSLGSHQAEAHAHFPYRATSHSHHTSRALWRGPPITTI